MTLTILSIVFLGIGGTFAYLTVSVNATNITQIKSGNLTMTIDGGGNENVTLFPSKCTSDYAIKKTIKASTTNTSGGKVSFSIGMNITTLSNELKRDTMRYILSTTSDNCSAGIIAGGTFKDKSVGDEIWLIKNDYDNITKSGSTYTKTYYLYIWLDESETESITSGNISVNMKGSSSNNPDLPAVSDYDDGNGENTLFYQIKSNADKYTRIDFSKTSEKTNTNGIYVTTNTDNGVPVYYYRGNVDNHVIFANFCWRIVRTTETGGVKLIYDGVPTDGQCNNTGDDTTIGSSRFNLLSLGLPTGIGYMYGTRYAGINKTISSLTGSIVFGNDVTYDTNTNTYTLIDTYTLTDPSSLNKDSTEYATITGKYHYTCFISGNTCEKINYIYYTHSGSLQFIYFELSNGKRHLDILKEVLDNSTNENDSTAKTTIDTWYQNNMIDYTSQLEDTAFCNDRSYDASKTGFNKDYSNSDSNLFYSGRQRTQINKQPSLICPSVNDRFTTNSNNGNGALIYPVGLITVDESMYAGGAYYPSNSSYFLNSGINNWSFSPGNFHNVYNNSFYIDSTGSLNSTGAGNANGLRPVISLKKGTIISSGNGTSKSPYIVE